MSHLPIGCRPAYPPKPGTALRRICTVLHYSPAAVGGAVILLCCICTALDCLQDVLSRFKAVHGTKWELLPEKAVFQMNDTHPTIAVAELTRLLVDVEGLPWEQAWEIVGKVRRNGLFLPLPEE